MGEFQFGLWSACRFRTDGAAHMKSNSVLGAMGLHTPMNILWSVLPSFTGNTHHCPPTSASPQPQRCRRLAQPAPRACVLRAGRGGAAERVAFVDWNGGSARVQLFQSYLPVSGPALRCMLLSVIMCVPEAGSAMRVLSIACGSPQQKGSGMMCVRCEMYLLGVCMCCPT